MSKSDTFENDLVKLLFNGTAISNIADNAATSPATVLWLALHSADPGEAGTQTTSEVAYTGYGRVSVARTSAGWTVTNNQAALAAAAVFGACTGGSATAGFWSVGTAQTGTGKVLYSGTISPTISISNGVTPQLNAGTNVTED
jgi:hypothetical protein